MLKIKTSIFNTSCLSKWESTTIKKFTLVKKKPFILVIWSMSMQVI